MRVYVAGGVNRIATVRAVMAALRAAGHAITYDWTARYDARPAVLTTEWMQETARLELTGVIEADETIALPGGRGTAIETGFALATYRRPVVLLREQADEAPPCPFDFLCIMVVGPESEWPRLAVGGMANPRECPECHRTIPLFRERKMVQPVPFAVFMVREWRCPCQAWWLEEREWLE